MKKGKFIVVDSGEGAGKTSQLNKVKEIFGEDNFVFTREPGGSPYASEIRKIILNSENAKQADAKTAFALFWAARADHLKNLIIPALTAGKTVICDRFDSSTFAYQIFAEKHQELEPLFWEMRKFYLGDFTPDLYVYFNVDPAVGIARKFQQGPSEVNHFEERPLEFHERMREGFKTFLTHVPHCIVDANQSFEEVWKNFKEIIEEPKK